MGIFVVIIISLIIVISVISSTQTKDYMQSCRDSGGVPIDSGRKYTSYNCWSNKEKGYIDVK